MKKKSVLFLFMCLLLLGACSQSNSSTSENPTPTKTATTEPKSNFPEKPIQLILPIPPGSSYDVLARTIADQVSEFLPNNQSVVVVNKPGGANTIGVAEIFNAKPDGYTIGFVPTSTLTTAPHYGNTPYTFDSFQPIIRISRVDGMVYVRDNEPFTTFEEWLAYVKENPGKFSIGTVQGGKAVLTKLNKDAGIDVNVVPFDGSALAMTAFLGEHVNAVLAVPAEAKDLVESGEIRPIFSTSGSQIEDAPILKEKGFSIEENKMTGIIAPKGLPKEELTILHEAFKQASETPKTLELIKKLGLQPFYGTPEEFQTSLTESFKLDGETLKAADLIK